MDSVVIQGVELRLSPPDELDWEWVGRPELRRQLLAAWMVLDDHDHQKQYGGVPGGEAVLSWFELEPHEALVIEVTPPPCAARLLVCACRLVSTPTCEPRPRRWA